MSKIISRFKLSSKDDSLHTTGSSSSFKEFVTADPERGAIGVDRTAIPGLNADDALLESLGYKAELKREFSPLELFGVSFSIMSLAPSIASVLTYAIPAGGVGLTWGWFVPCVFIMSIGLNMSEMASAMPTAGGLYWWTYKYAPPRFKSYLSFLCGYADTLGLIAGTGSINYGAAEQILSCATLNNGYNPSNGVTFAVFAACTLLQCAMGCLPNKIIVKLQTATIFFNAVAICLIVIALPIGMHHNGIPLNSGSYVFGDTTNETSYPYGMSFMLAWMAPIWTISSQDACVHMAEEATNATTAVPFGILMSVGLCWILGFLIMTIIAACIDGSSDGLQNLMNSNLPLGDILQRGLNTKWAVGIMSLFAFIQYFMGLSSIIATSRQVYAFARDDALPFSRWVKLTTKSHLPVPALIFAATVCLLLGLLILAGDTAASAIFDLGMSSLYLAWCLPIFCYTFSTQAIANPGPFYLGYWPSKINALIASCYGFYVIFGLSMLPSDIPVDTADEMNYTCVVCGAVWIGASLYWLFDARKWYNGPKMTTSDEEVAEVLEAAEWEAVEKEPTKEKKQAA